MADAQPRDGGGIAPPPNPLSRAEQGETILPKRSEKLTMDGTRTPLCEGKEAELFLSPRFCEVSTMPETSNMPNHIPSHDSDLLLLRSIVPDDAEAYHTLVTDPTVKQFSTSKGGVASVEQYRKWFGNTTHKAKDVFAVICKSSDCFAGICGFRDNGLLQELFPELSMTEITIQLLAPYRRRGFGKTLVTVLLRHAFEKQHRHLVIAIPHPCNKDSIEFLSKIGMPQWLCIVDYGEHSYRRSTVYAKNHD